MSISSIAGRAGRIRRNRRLRHPVGHPLSAQNRPIALALHHEVGGFAAPWPRDPR